MPSEQFIVRSKFPSYEIPNISVGEFLLGKIQRIIETDPKKVALIDALTDSSLTYKQLHEQANEIGVALLHGGALPAIEKTDICMFFGDNTPQYVVLLLTMAYLGVTITPSKPANGAYETYQHLSNSGTTILCVSASKLPVIAQILNDAKHAQLLTSLKMLIILEEGDAAFESIRSHPAAPKGIVTVEQLRRTGSAQMLPQIPHFKVDPKRDNHVIVYTSGSTGLPKGALQTHRSFISSIMAMLHKNAFTKNVGGTINFIFPLGHISGTVFVMDCLSNQMTLVLFGEVTSHSVLLEAIKKYQVTVAIITLALGADLLKNEEYSRYDLSSLKSVYFSGSRLPDTVSLGLIKKFGINMYEIYGATEFMGCVTNNGEYVPGKIGAPLPNVEMKIVDLGSGDSLPSGKEGEVCFRGPNCFAGYLNNEKATRDTIDELGWYHTGDVGYYDNEECLHITDRIKELIKYKHWTIAPAEIEGFLQTHPAVSGACVVGVKHRSEGQHSRAYVQLAEGKSATEDDIVRFVKENMGYQNRLNGGVRFVSDIPRISMGKIDRQYFKQLIKDEVITEEAEKP